MHIRRPQATDLSGMAKVASDAMFNDAVTAFVAPYRYQHPECLRLGFLRRARRRMYSGKYLLIAVTDQQDPDWDGTERVVGYLSATSTKRKAEQARQSYFSWNSKLLMCTAFVFLLMFPDLELAAVWLETFFIDISGADRSMSPQNQRIYVKAFQAAYNHGPFANLPDFWDVDFLVVDPAFHRRGIGTALLERVQNSAAEEGVPVTLLASVMGSHLYRKAGFTGLGEVKIGLYHLFEAMIWYPIESEVTDVKRPRDS